MLLFIHLHWFKICFSFQRIVRRFLAPTQLSASSIRAETVCCAQGGVIVLLYIAFLMDSTFWRRRNWQLQTTSLLRVRNRWDVLVLLAKMIRWSQLHQVEVFSYGLCQTGWSIRKSTSHLLFYQEPLTTCATVITLILWFLSTTRKVSLNCGLWSSKSIHSFPTITWFTAELLFHVSFFCQFLIDFCHNLTQFLST